MPGLLPPITDERDGPLSFVAQDWLTQEGE